MSLKKTYLSNEALELYYEYEREVFEGKYPPNFVSAMEKTTGRNLRIALIIHILDNICKFIECEEIASNITKEQLTVLGSGENKDIDKAYGYFGENKDRPDFCQSNNKITYDQMERAIALTRYLNKVAEQVYSEHFAENRAGTKTTEFVLQNDEQKRIRIIRNFIQANMAMAMKFNTIKAFKEADLDTSLWQGDARKMSGWLKKHGVSSKKTNQRRG